ncbi:MAG: (E)-4-hydroxy-3-methylbut-2-enyl-diphosphate synthase [Verrucomicrobia bacterium]|nr:(E)-4-hydroxy-3-methylbut-2-enyl-diphosphate synthase [Verrucomicrobiota bacterium]
MNYCDSPIYYRRRPTREVAVGDPARGGVIIGGAHPIVVQSMITSDTMDTSESVRQTLELAAAGCELVRITAPTVKDAANLRNIAGELRARGCRVPLAADIHFKPEAAFEAAQWVEKIRINPGNFADGKKFVLREYDDAAYAAEVGRLAERFAPLAVRCGELKRAMRIGANHGSLSDRILSRWGDTPRGMVESALEYARIARSAGFHDLVFSMKASNPKVMIQSYRLLAARLSELGPDWSYPLHLGVTEAGEGEDGRIKSAIGIGALLADGLGDTIRVSLTEDSTREIPVCRELLAEVAGLAGKGPPGIEIPPPFDPFSYARRPAVEIDLGDGIRCGGSQTVRVVVPERAASEAGGALRAGSEVQPEAIVEELEICEADPSRELGVSSERVLVTVKDGLDMPVIAAFRLLAHRLREEGRRNPILLKDCLAPPQASLAPSRAQLRSAVALGALLVDGIGDAILVRNEKDARASVKLAYDILQAAGCRSFKADYVACPSCGRTLFDLQSVTARIKARTQHLQGVRIAIMGCIVNGPGEMADADFGYVGGAPGKVNLYVGKRAVRFNLPEADAVERLVDLIREHGRWIEPGNGRQ